MIKLLGNGELVPTHFRVIWGPNQKEFSEVRYVESFMLEKTLKLIESTINQTLPEYPSIFPYNTCLWSRSFICYTPES